MSLSDQASAGRVGFYVLKVQVDVLTCAAGGTMQQLYKNPTFARKVTIQNITTTAATIVTVVSESGTGNGFGGAANQGDILNAGSAVNTGGGSMTFGDTADPKALVDASKIYWTATNTSDKVSVTLEIAGERLF